MDNGESRSSTEEVVTSKTRTRVQVQKNIRQKRYFGVVKEVIRESIDKIINGKYRVDTIKGDLSEEALKPSESMKVRHMYNEA